MINDYVLPMPSMAVVVSLVSNPNRLSLVLGVCLVVEVKGSLFPGNWVVGSMFVVCAQTVRQIVIYINNISVKQINPINER